MTMFDPPQPWMRHANCIDTDPAIFFPDRYTDTAAAARQARRICASCPVRQECLDYAIDHHEPAGMWGGMTVKERRTERRRRLHLLQPCGMIDGPGDTASVPGPDQTPSRRVR